MTSELYAVCFDAGRPEELAGFWGGLLGWERDGAGIVPPGGGGFRMRFVPEREPKTRKNQAHFDLTSASPQEQRRTVARALELGGTHVDVGQRPEDGHVVLADPEGNEFCVIEAGNDFLAGTGFVGALACDGTQAVGYFWSEALRWPLVWDQDQETAIQSPAGGTKLTWGGPPVPPKTGPNRLYLELMLPAGAEGDAELDRLVALGATRVSTGEFGDVDRVMLLDPDGNEFAVTGSCTA